LGATAAAAEDVGHTAPEQKALEGTGYSVEERSTDEIILRVGNSTDVKQLASSISFALQDSKRVVLRAVGASAVNQMAKACAIARTYVAGRGVDLSVRPGFATVKMKDLSNPSGPMQDQTAIVFILKVD
jgi:stage V sporulation protein S